MDPAALGAVYRGRAEFRAPVAQSTKTAAERRASRSRGEAERRQTIAERKQAELANVPDAGRQSTRDKSTTPDEGGEL
jgi:preprotein translocase subunit SecD